MKEIKEKLARVGELVDALAAREDALERDLALGLLREIYAELKFGTMEAARDDATGNDAGAQIVPAVNAAAESEENVENGAETLPDTLPNPVAEKIVETSPSARPVVPRRVDPRVIRSLYGDDDELAPRQMQQPAAEAEAAPEANDAPEATAAPEASASEITAPKQQDQPVTEPLLVATPDPAATPEPAAEPQPAVSEPTPEPAVESKSAEMSKPALEQEQKPEPLPKPTTTPTPGPKPAPTLRPTPKPVRPSLKSLIGVNDRFMMIRELFGGDGAAFDGAITRLDGFDDLDSAIIYIHDTYQWQPDSAGAAMIVGLLERKFA